jgi:hypothetical protein
VKDKMGFFSNSSQRAIFDEAENSAKELLSRRDGFDLSVWSFTTAPDKTAPGIMRVRVTRMAKPMRYFDIFIRTQDMVVVGEAATGMHFPR